MKKFKMFVLDADNNVVSNELVNNGNITVDGCTKTAAINKVEKLLNITGTVMLYSEKNNYLGSSIIEKKH